ncbi:MAG: helix-turn-helix transcriptional regulator [Trueperaceae bacterium]|nr:helix-turn-helix transcriptional regulator [Trueperaceae bacterium]
MIGKKIHTLRKAKHMTLQQMSEISGLSVSFLSQVERDLASPTVTSLVNIAHALGVQTSYFFPQPPSENLVVRSYERHPFKLEDGKIVYARLGGDFNGRTLEPMLVTYPPQFESEWISHPGEEFIYMLEGQVKVFFDELEYCLNPHDSMHLPSNHSHRICNSYNIPAQVIFVNTPRFLD